MSLDTRPRAMSPEDIDRILEALKSDKGASITVQDPSMTRFKDWLIGLVGISSIMTLGWMANSLDTLSKAFERASVRQEYTQRTVDEHSVELKEHTKRIGDLERKP